MTAALEDNKKIEIDDWKTLNTSASPTRLVTGQTPDAKNVWVDEKPGSVITANGYRLVGTLPSGNPGTFGIDYFKSSTGAHLAVLSDNETVWTTTDFVNFTSIITGLSSSFQLRGKIIRDKLWLTNGSDDVRVYDGTTVTVLDGGGATPNVPLGRYIEYHDERVWIYHISGDRSSVRFSALVDSTGAFIEPDSANAWPVDNEIQISEGDADFGTGMILYRGFLHFFKQYSVWRLVGYDEYTYDRVKTRASTGTRFSESLQELDGLIQMIGNDGMYTFDGDQTDRISDLIDPATASQTAFGFNQLQQPNTNNQFWQTTDTADFNAGTVAANLDVADAISLGAFDDSKVDFDASALLTNIDTTYVSGSARLSVTTTGHSDTNVALDQTASLVPVATGTTTIGVGSYVTDGNTSNRFGFSHASALASGNVLITIPFSSSLTRVVIKGFVSDRDGSIYLDNGGGFVTPSSVSHTGGSGGLILVSGDHIAYQGTLIAATITITYPAFTSTQIRMFFSPATAIVTVYMTEIEVYTAAYNTAGQITSRTLDLGLTPTNLGNFNADCTIPTGTTLTFFTQGSADGVSWDVAQAVTNGGPIAGTLRRYLRYYATYTSTGANTPQLDAVYLPSVYLSAIHDTGGSLFSWGPVEVDYDTSGQSILFYYRTATTSLGVSSATWNVIAAGAVISDSVLNQFVQFKIEFLGAALAQAPTVRSLTINWVVGTGTQPQTTQNVGSTIWRNRYWLTAAGEDATENDTILIRGKKTFGSPWQLKDWSILFFFKFYDSLYGLSSVDGSIYSLDTGYSKDGSAMDAYFTTGDVTFGGFFVTVNEVLIEVERTGPYNLTMGISNDRGATFTDYTVDLTDTGSDSYTKRLNVSVMGDKIRFRVRINGIDQPYQVHRLVAFYTLQSSRGSIN